MTSTSFSRCPLPTTVAACATGACLLAVLLPLASGCRRDTHPNVVLITLDTTRADRLGVMGDAEAKTPNLDALAARGALFERAYASAPLTLPSHTTILTGLDPNRHGVHDNGRFVVPASVETLAERLAARGYATAAFVAAFVLHRSFGLDRGFSVYDDDIDIDRNPLSFTVPSRRGQVVTDRALAWLARSRRAPYFLWVHYYDVHVPRRPPPPFDAFEDQYAGALAYVDAEVRRLLDGVDRAAAGRATLIIVVADHGESLGDHDELTHGVLAYDSTLHVPLLVAGPGFPPGTRSRAAVRTADVAPTILAAVGEAPLKKADGRPLQQQLSGDVEEINGYFECFAPEYNMGWARIAGVRTGRWKYTAEPKPGELYDVVADPQETDNRVEAEPALVGELEQRYAALKPAAAAAPPPALPPDVQEKLAALGYWEAAQDFETGAAPDPRNYVDVAGLVDSARSLASEGRVPESIEVLQVLTSSPVSRPLALRSLAPLFQLVGRRDEAIDAYRDLGKLTRGFEAQLGLAHALMAAERAQDALTVLDAPSGDSAPPSRLLLARGQALLQLGRPGEAEQAAKAALERDGEDDAALALASRARAVRDGAAAEIPRVEQILNASPAAARLVQTRRLLAELLHDQERDVEAVRVLEAVPNPPPEYRVLLAEIAAARGNLPKAATLYESAVRDQPANQSYRQALADTYDALGRSEDALKSYDAMIAANPKDATLLVDRGAIRFRAGRKSEAEADYRQAIALDPSLPEAFLNLALLELEAGRDNDAERNLLRAVELRPDYAKAHFHLARLYGQRGDARAALHADRAVAASVPAATSPDESPEARRPRGARHKPFGHAASAEPSTTPTPAASADAARRQPRQQKRAVRERMRELRRRRAEQLAALPPQERERLQAEATKRRQEEHDLLLRQLADPDGAIRAEAVRRLEADGDDGQRLRHLLAHDPDPRVRAVAASQLSFSEAAAAGRSLLQALHDPDSTVVIAAIESLTFVGDDSIIPDLRPLLEHPDPQVRQHAAAAVKFLQ